MLIFLEQVLSSAEQQMNQMNLMANLQAAEITDKNVTYGIIKKAKFEETNYND